ncbi:MAG: adenylate/guanylate cyclase domain-containing protein [Cytophagales bacterium]|nr:adenylate/guanylate cyclase domain-containing protein [Cytophagales bacterium]
MSQRQLAAIMFTDIVGYTAMMQRNEQETIEIVERQRSILKEKAKRYRGEITQFYRDGNLILFQSVLQAVQCAISIQEASHPDPFIPLRIGIHSGEIIRKGKHVNRMGSSGKNISCPQQPRPIIATKSKIRKTADEQDLEIATWIFEKS